MAVCRMTPRAPGVAAMLTVSMSSSLVPTLPICGKVKVMIWPGIGGIGEDLLVAGHGGVEADLADRLAGGAEADAFQHGAVGQHQQGGGLGLGPARPKVVGLGGRAGCGRRVVCRVMVSLAVAPAPGPQGIAAAAFRRGPSRAARRDQRRPQGRDEGRRRAPHGLDAADGQFRHQERRYRGARPGQGAR